MSELGPGVQGRIAVLIASFAAVAVGGGMPAVSRAQTEGESSEVEEREASMFGESDEDSDEKRRGTDPKSTPEPPEEGASEGGREAEMFGPAEESDEESGERPERETGPSLAERFEERLEEKSDPLQLGGTYFGRFEYTMLEEGAPGEFPLVFPNIVDLYLDARPTDRLRFYTEGRLFYDPTVDPDDADLFGGSRRELDIDLDQLWLKFDIARAVFVTVGRQHLRWGVGRFWHPNDFLFAQKRDPLAIFDDRTGVDLVKFHVPFEKLGWNFYAVGQLGGADTPEELGTGARLEMLIDQTELGLAGSYRDGAPLQIGIDLSAGVGRFDVRAAGAALYGDETTYYRGRLDLASLSAPDPRNWQVPTAISREDEWLFRALAGAEIGFRVFEDDTLLVGGEYFFNEPGYGDEELYPWLLLQGAFRPFYVGRHYGGVYAALPSPGAWDDTSFTLSTLGNLSDRSFLSRFDFRLTVLTRLQFYAYGAVQYGSRGEFNLRVEVPPVRAPGVPPELSDGLAIPAVSGRAGIGLQLAF